ncbi:MAG TPA: CinA family protein [Opitutaceae bacterium]|nr:CinA family protein [Opitutaceae bacterium]
MLKKLFESHPTLRLAVAESLTGGNVQARVSAESGASEFFVGGVTAYNLDQKVALLGVNRAKAKASDCVSAEIAREMARGACKLMKCKLAVATTGYAERDPAKGVTVPHAHWAVCHLVGRGRAVFIDGYGEFPRSSRQQVQARVSDEAIAALAKYLKSLSGK